MTVFAQHTQYAIVNEVDAPMNHWGIFTNPVTSVRLFGSLFLAEKELQHMQRTFPKSEFRTARVVEACVTWPKMAG
jgi:hypothetical protein